MSLIEEKELPMAVATSNTRKLAMTALHAQDIEHYFRVIITGEDVVKGKPDPFVYHLFKRFEICMVWIVGQL